MFGVYEFAFDECFDCKPIYILYTEWCGHLHRKKKHFCKF